MVATCGSVNVSLESALKRRHVWLLPHNITVLYASACPHWSWFSLCWWLKKKKRKRGVISCHLSCHHISSSHHSWVPKQCCQIPGCLWLHKNTNLTDFSAMFFPSHNAPLTLPYPQTLSTTHNLATSVSVDYWPIFRLPALTGQTNSVQPSFAPVPFELSHSPTKPNSSSNPQAVCRDAPPVCHCTV